MWGSVLFQFDLLGCALILISSWNVAEAISKNVSDARALRTALEEQDVDRIFLDDSVFLRGYDGWDLSRTGPIILERSVTIEGDRQWGRHITIDLGDILTGENKGMELFRALKQNVTITFQSVHLVGLPFTPANRDVSLLAVNFVFDRSIIEVFYSPTDSHPDWLAWLSNSRAQQYPAQGTNPDLQLLRAVNKTFCDKWCGVSCPNAEYVYLEDVSHHMGLSDPELTEERGMSVEQTGVLYALDCMLILVSINRKVVTDSSSFGMALRDPVGHRTTITIEGEVTLWEANLGCPFTLRHDVTIQGSSSATPPTDVLDFNVIRNCTVIPPTISLTVQNLILAKAVLYMPVLNLEFPWQSIMAFFNPRPNAAVNVDNVVWHVHYLEDSPLSAATIQGDLSGKGRDPKRGVGPLDSSKVQLTHWVDSKWCQNYTAYGDTCSSDDRCVELTKCPHDAVFVKDVQYNFLPPGVFLPPGAHYRIMRSLLIPSTTDRSSVNLDLETKGRRRTPVLIIVILVGLGVAGFAIAASALILSKMRSKSRAEKHLSYGTDTDGFYTNDFDPNDVTATTFDDFHAKSDVEMQNVESLRKSSGVVVVEDSKFAIAAQRAAEKMFGNISLGTLLGQGAFGRVYKATWNGAVVAVKVIEMTPEGPNQQTSIDREVNLLLELRHPNIVNLYHAAARQLNKDRSYSAMLDVGDVSLYGNEGGGATEATDSENPPTSSPQKDLGVGETWMVMEFCDQGTLRELLKNDFFFQDERKKSLKMEWVLYTCQDIARGFQYLHEQNMIHGDLKPHNVFLSTNGQDSRRFIAKIGDFGVSRKMQTSQVYTATFGTMAYMPPELLGQSKLTDKADVYAYGIIMWQLTTGDTPFPYANAADVWRKVVIENFRPAFPSYVPEDYQALAARCWDTNPHNRPIFDEVMEELSTILQKVMYTP